MYDCIPVIAEISSTISAAAERALNQIHQRGFAHGDVRLENFVLGRSPNANTVMVIDLARSSPGASQDVLAQEAEELRLLLEKRTHQRSHHHISSGGGDDACCDSSVMHGIV